MNFIGPILFLEGVMFDEAIDELIYLIEHRIFEWLTLEFIDNVPELFLLIFLLSSVLFTLEY